MYQTSLNPMKPPFSYGFPMVLSTIYANVFQRVNPMKSHSPRLGSPEKSHEKIATSRHRVPSAPGAAKASHARRAVATGLIGSAAGRE